ncbi:hypothetical protein L1987_85732 [Smallanthus sonchifolius]|uniref:Uncharacterized protein n=1 Tax=Smallanthus sonchifolius TaxID=185202 RepID=A0ACB8XY53_9ASTR|nr:hypothetical protein L1987_85732 [Smallanthus sonchifolius]
MKKSKHPVEETIPIQPKTPNTLGSSGNYLEDFTPMQQIGTNNPTQTARVTSTRDPSVPSGSSSQNNDDDPKTINQNDDEALKDYRNRFGGESSKIPNLDLATANQTLKAGSKRKDITDFVPDFSSDIQQEADLEVQQLEGTNDT